MNEREQLAYQQAYLSSQHVTQVLDTPLLDEQRPANSTRDRFSLARTLVESAGASLNAATEALRAMSLLTGDKDMVELIQATAVFKEGCVLLGAQLEEVAPKIEQAIQAQTTPPPLLAEEKEAGA